ncbi:MAG: hypothetical protein RML46_10845, partial [Anaerolineae bacterium]|nr:hypothetical protein [Anaerolineae bacterium]
MNAPQIPRGYYSMAQEAARRIAAVLQQRQLLPPVDWLLTEDEGMVWLLGVLDPARTPRLEAYDDNVLHHLSTALRGLPVFRLNSTGLMLATLLSRPPSLPRLVEFPGLQRGIVRIGLSARGPVEVPWARLGHLLVAGMTGSGKSSFLRLLAYQALADGARLLAADPDGTTFPMLKDDRPGLMMPVARTVADMPELVYRALGEVEHRARLYARVPGYPENLDEYNGLAVRAGQEPLPRLLVILDEFNGAVMALGGPRREFASSVARLGWQGRKFGIHLVFAAQDFSKEVIGRVRDQVGTVVCFRVRSGETALRVGCAGAERLGVPGRGVTDRWGVVQTYRLDKGLLDGPSPALSEREIHIVRWALEENGGYLGLADLQGRFGLGHREARRLAEEWERRG